MEPEVLHDIGDGAVVLGWSVGGLGSEAKGHRRAFIVPKQWLYNPLVEDKAKEKLRLEGVNAMQWHIYYEKVADKMAAELKKTAIRITPAELMNPEGPPPEPVRKPAATPAPPSAQPPPDAGIILSSDLPPDRWDEEVWVVEKGEEPAKTRFTGLVGRKKEAIRLMSPDMKSGWKKPGEYFLDQPPAAGDSTKTTQTT